MWKSEKKKKILSFLELHTSAILSSGVIYRKEIPLLSHNGENEKQIHNRTYNM